MNTVNDALIKFVAPRALKIALQDLANGEGRSGEAWGGPAHYEESC